MVSLSDCAAVSLGASSGSNRIGGADFGWLFDFISSRGARDAKHLADIWFAGLGVQFGNTLRARRPTVHQERQAYASP